MHSVKEAPKEFDPFSLLPPDIRSDLQAQANIIGFATQVIRATLDNYKPEDWQFGTILNQETRRRWEAKVHTEKVLRRFGLPAMYPDARAILEEEQNGSNSIG